MIARRAYGFTPRAVRIVASVPATTLMLALCWTTAAAAQSLTVSSASAAPPDAMAPAIAAQLQTSADTVHIGDATLEFWWVKAVQVSAEGPGWSSVESGTLVGAARVTGPFKEIRGKPVKPGAYTLRFGLQPQNGDHLGISANREFLLLSPAEVDRDPKVLGFDGVVALAKQTIGTSHPASLSLDPPEEATGAARSPMTNDLGHKGVVIEVKQSLNGKTVGAITFGLIVNGLIVH